MRVPVSVWLLINTMWLLKGKFSSQLVLQLGLFWSSLLHPQWVVLFSCLDHSYRFPLSSKHIWLHVQGFFCFPNTLQDIWILVPRLLLVFSFEDSTSLHFVFCFWIKTLPGVWLPLPQLLFWETPTDVSLIELWLVISLLFCSFWEMIDLQLIDWVAKMHKQACVFNHTSQAMILKSNKMQPNQRIRPLSST